jgi:hypothetical protein
MAERINLPHTCPQCGKTATTTDELMEYFGLRQMDETTIRSQSWCRECRSAS